MNTNRPIILLIEDDDFISTYLDDKLKEQFDTVLVTNAADARQALQDQPVHLIVLDILLPDEDGFSFLESIQAKDSPHRHIPVIILSNLGQPEHVDRGLSLGAVEYLVKANYTPDEIAERIAATLRQSSSS